MKFSIQREAILKPLMQVVGVVERRQTLPVLSNLLVNATSDGIVFIGTDLEVEMRATLNQPVDQTGEVTIPARKLVDICKALPDGATVDFTVSDDRATIVGGRSRFTLATLPATEFPVIEDVDVDRSVQVKQADLKKIIDRTSFAMANQDVRYYLNGMLLELQPERLRAVATDGHRLAICDAETNTQTETTTQMIIPRKGVIELQRLLDDSEDQITIEFGQSHIRVILLDCVFTSKLIDGRFPEYESVIPAGADQSLSGDKDVICQALQRAAILSNEKYRGVRLEVQPDRLKIIAHNPEQEEAVDEVEVSTSVSDLAMGFNVNYLLDAMNSLDDEMIDLAFKDANSSCLITARDDMSARHVVMPLRL